VEGDEDLAELLSTEDEMDEEFLASLVPQTVPTPVLSAEEVCMALP
jgi:hypothetical protein